MSLRMTIILLLFVTTKLASATTNISAEIIRFCTCWEALILCEDQTVFVIIKTENCPKRFVWEQPAASVTQFQVITSYNGTNVASSISCERIEGIICKQPIVPFASDVMTFGFAVKIAPVCFRFNNDHCNCLPIHTEITSCRPKTNEIKTKDTTTKETNESKEITIAMCIPLLVVICIVSLIIVVRIYHYIARKRNHIEHRHKNDEVEMIPLSNVITQ